nr:carbonate dehydratase [Cyanobacteria bacterium UBA8530]
DKTGTLTKNEMTVTAILAGGGRYEVTGVGYHPEGAIRREGEKVSPDSSRALEEITRAGILCNESRLIEHGKNWRIEGDPTEGALLVVAIKAGLDPGCLRDEAEALDSIPFESERQFMATLHQIPDQGHVVYLKGAVERVLAMCEAEMDPEGKIIPFDRAKANQSAEALAKEGLRVLAFAKKSLPGQTTLHPRDVETGMVFLGLQAMIDPPRAEAIAAVKACQDAGISVKMITGDHALTAQAIARQMSIGGDRPLVIEGAQLAKLSDEELKGIALKSDVFARVIPEQKLRLVKTLQGQGAVVAMTGDGVNDAPALKQADIGIAMGLNGTEVAKDAADMVLIDDNFASIEAAVEEGRGVYDNLRKFIIWTLPTNGGEGLLLIIAIAAGLVLPILPLHLLWINMTTSVALGTVLAFEPKEAGLMKRPARAPNEPILTGDMMARIVYVSVLMVIGAYILYFWELSRGLDLVAARTVVASVVVAVEIAYLFNCRSLSRPVWEVGFFSNRWALWGVLIMVSLQLAFVYLPPMQWLFQTASVPLESWFDVAVVVLVVYLLVETEKWLRRESFFRKARD